MPQESVWDKEYKNSKLLVKENLPSTDIVKFVKFLKKTIQHPVFGDFNTGCLNVLDLGSGMGRNSFYFAELGAKVLGLEISRTAIEIAQKNLIEANKLARMPLAIEYKKQSIGEKFPCEDVSMDVAIDVMSSNSLTEKEREVYLSETNRVLKDGSYFFVKSLCKDGDENAKYLLKNNPGHETDTYVLPDVGVVERVWSREDFEKTYQKYFTILNLEKKTTYTKMNNRSYKRSFWICYMKKMA